MHAASSTAFRLQEGVQSLDFGVCLFFFLSAFLITRLLLLEREATGEVAIGRFYLRRCLRIWPLYYFFLGLVLALSYLFPVLDVSWSRVLAAAFFVSNWAAVLHGWSGMAIQPLWSVSVEEQFYFVWPAFARFGRRAIITGSAALVLLAVGVLLYFGYKPGAQMTATWPNTFVQGLFLAAGALTACLSTPEARRLANRTRFLFLALGLCCWLAASVGCHIMRTQSPGPALLVVGYLLVLAGTMLIFNGVAGWKERRLPAWSLYLGKISYGLYVFHVACLLLMEQAVMAALNQNATAVIHPYLVECISATLAMALTIGCASLTYRLLETPFLRLKGRFSAVQSRPV